MKSLVAGTAALLLVLGFNGGVVAEQERVAETFRSPFHPDECLAAIAEARRQFAMHGTTLRWQRVLGQGFLCMGLKDGPLALDQAAATFRAVLAKDPDDLTAQVGLADAVRRRTPLSPDALAQLRKAQRLLAAHPQTAGPRYLDSYLAENVHALEQRRSQSQNETTTQDGGQNREAQLSTRGQIETDLERGRGGYNSAHRHAIELLAAEGFRSSAVTWLAEVLYQRGHYAMAHAMFAWVLAKPCRLSPPNALDCNVAREREAKLAEERADWRQIESNPEQASNIEQAMAAATPERGALWAAHGG